MGVFLDLLLARVEHVIVCNRCNADEDVGFGNFPVDRFEHLLGAGDGNGFRRRGRSQTGRSGNQGDFRAGFDGGAGDGVTHFSRTHVGDGAHCVDCFVGWSGSDQHALVFQQLGMPERFEILDQNFRFHHPPHAGFAAGLRAAGRAEDGDVVALELGDVAMGGGVVPHFPVHRRGDQERAGARQANGGEQVVRGAVCELGDKIGAGRGDQHRVGTARDVDVRHAAGRLAVP